MLWLHCKPRGHQRKNQATSALRWHHQRAHTVVCKGGCPIGGFPFNGFQHGCVIQVPPAHRFRCGWRSVRVGEASNPGPVQTRSSSKLAETIKFPPCPLLPQRCEGWWFRWCQCPMVRDEEPTHVDVVDEGPDEASVTESLGRDSDVAPPLSPPFNPSPF